MGSRHMVSYLCTMQTVVTALSVLAAREFACDSEITPRMLKNAGNDAIRNNNPSRKPQQLDLRTFEASDIFVALLGACRQGVEITETI